jgi:molecular chaperone DnaK
VLTGEVKDVLLLDVTPLSLGVETLGGVFTKLIERNATIPTRKSELFSTSADSQTSVEIHVLQGEREMAAGNKSLGRFILDGIPPAPRGVPQVEVTFDIDANGILNVSAKDKATGKEQSIRIEASSGLTEEEINRMVKESQVHAAEDRQRREEVDARNQAAQVIYQTEKNLKEMADRINPEVKAKIEAAVERDKQALKGKKVGEIKSATEALNQVWDEAAAQMYAQTAQGTSTAEPTEKKQYATAQEESSPEKGEAVDADFEVVG